MNEAGFWRYLQRGMGSRWKAERVENRLAAGFPDVFYTINGVHGLVELKYLPEKKTNVSIRSLTDDQRSFSFRHGTFILVQIEDEYLLFDYHRCMDLGRGQPLSEHRSWAVGRWEKRLDFDHLARLLSTGPGTR